MFGGGPELFCSLQGKLSASLLGYLRYIIELTEYRMLNDGSHLKHSGRGGRCIELCCAMRAAFGFGGALLFNMMR
jgi:hypothetical protein